LKKVGEKRCETVENEVHPGRMGITGKITTDSKQGEMERVNKKTARKWQPFSQQADYPS